MAEPRSIDWINTQANKLYEFFQTEVCEDKAKMRDVFLVNGAFLRGMGASLSGKDTDDLNDLLEDAFDEIDKNIDSLGELVYLLGIKLLNVGLNMNLPSNIEDGEDLEGVEEGDLV
jgi:hypothetical protein